MPDIEIHTQFHIPDEEFEQAINKAIENHPDYMLVVHCGSCKFSDISKSISCGYICKNKTSPCRNRTTYADFGCLYGERREGE